MATKVWYQYSPWNNFMQLWNGQPINGDDIAMPEGTPITAVFAGTITRQYVDDAGGIQIIKVDNPSQTKGIPYYYFAHFDTFASGLKVGDHVNAGDVIGTSGGQNSGGTYNASPQWSTGPHIMIGLSKTNSIPVGNQVTPDLNPAWLVSYANGQKLGINQIDFGNQSPNSLIPNPFQAGQDAENAINAIQNLASALANLPKLIPVWGEVVAIFWLGILFIALGIMLLSTPASPKAPVAQVFVKGITRTAKKGKQAADRARNQAQQSGKKASQKKSGKSQGQSSKGQSATSSPKAAESSASSGSSASGGAEAAASGGSSAAEVAAIA